MKIEIDNGCATIDGVNYFKENDKTDLMQMINICTKWDVSDEVEEKLEEIIYNLLNRKKEDLDNMIHYYPDNAGYYLSKIDEVDSDLQKLGLL